MESTREKLHQAMMELCAEKSFRKVTAIEVAKKANVARSTFYTYYSDPYALVEEIEEEVLQSIDHTLVSVAEAAPLPTDASFPASFVAANYEHARCLDEHRDALYIFGSSETGDPTFIHRRLLQGEVANRKVVQRMGIVQHVDLIASYLANSRRFITRYWMRDAESLSVDEFVRVVFDLLWNPLLQIRDKYRS